MCDHALASASMDDYGTPYGGRLDGNLKAAKEEVEAYHGRKFSLKKFFKKWPIYKNWKK